MTASRIAAFGTWLGSLAFIIGALGGWHELSTPPVVAAIVGSFGAFLHALFTQGKPNA
jgi:hypothetical protein